MSLGTTMNHRGLASLLVSLALVCPVVAQDLPRVLAVAWNDLKGDSGHVDLMNLESPRDFTGSPLETGRFAVLRIKGNRIFAVCPEEDTIKSITREPWAIDRTYNLASGTSPVDIAVVDSNRAYVTGRNATHLLRLDLNSGATAESVDLSPFADSDGIPDLGDMVIFEGRLFVQIRRLNELAPRRQVAPPYLAVIDLATETLVDVDRALPGVQALALTGTYPKRPMQIVPSLRRLFVSATGESFDFGGIEMIDLDGLRSMGLVIREGDGHTGVDVRPFYFVEPHRGFLAYTTDLTISSHLVEFSIPDGVVEVNLHTEVDFLAPVLEFDATTNSLFFPSSGFTNPGVHVFDAATGERLTKDVIPTPGPPQDLVIWDTALETPDPPMVDIALHPGLRITGSLGATYEIQYSVDMSNWVPLTNVTLHESPFFWCDPTPVNQQGKRYYRALPLNR